MKNHRTAFSVRWIKLLGCASNAAWLVVLNVVPIAFMPSHIKP